MKSWTLHLLVPSLLAAVACQQVSGDDLDAGSNDTDDGTADQNEEAEGNDAEASGDGDGDGDNTGDGGGDGDGDGPCAGQSVALRLITGADAPGFGAGAVFESFGPQPQAREGVLVFTAYVIGGDAPPGTEALYRWDMVNETEPVLVAATGFAIPGTGLSPLGFNGLAVLAEDLSVGYQVVVSGEVHVLAYEGTEHREIIAEGVGTGPGATTIEFIPPFSNFDRGAAYFSGSFVSWVRVADPLGGAPDYAVFSREHEDDGSYLLQSDSIVGLPAGHAWVPQEARIHLGSDLILENELVVWSRVMGNEYDRGLVPFTNVGLGFVELGPLSSGWRQVGLAPSDLAGAYYYFDGDVGTFNLGLTQTTSFPIKNQPAAGLPGTTAYGDLIGFALSNSGALLFAADIVEGGGPQPTGDGLFRRSDRGVEELIALRGQAAPGVPATITNLHGAHVDFDGAVALRAILDMDLGSSGSGLFGFAAAEGSALTKVVATSDLIDLGPSCDPYSVLSVSFLHHGTPSDDIDIVPLTGGRQVAFEDGKVPVHLSILSEADGSAFEALVIAYTD